MTKCSLRTATDADAEAVNDVYLASRNEHLAFAPLKHTQETVCVWIAEHLVPGGGVTVAIEGVDVVAMMALSRDHDVGWIEQLYVHPLHVGHDIGTQLLERAKFELGPPIRLYTFQANTQASRFYERRGFQAIGYSDGTRNEEQCPDILYQWR